MMGSGFSLSPPLENRRLSVERALLEKERLEMSSILARLNRLRLLVQAALTSPRVRRNSHGVRVSRQTRPSDAAAWRFVGPPMSLPSLWGRASSLQPARSRNR